MVTAALPVLAVSAGVYFEYRVPSDTFLDLQDGPTRNLSLLMLTESDEVGYKVVWFVACAVVLVTEGDGV